MPSDPGKKVKNVVVIGGGAAGSLVAANLVRLGFEGKISLICGENATPGRGIAYSTTDHQHLLNVRASNMSAWPDHPTDFVEWVGGGEDVPHSFQPRMVYGDYLEGILANAVESGVNLIQTSATDIRQTGQGWDVFADGSWLAATHIVLALGNPLPVVPREFSALKTHPRVVSNPWEAGVLESILPTDNVLILGTGLTMVDTVLTLTSQKRSGALTAVSRKGLLPHAHKLGQPASESPKTYQDLISMAREAGEDWRRVVDAVRPKTIALWQSLSWEERARIARRLLGFWDIHRHRMPEQVAARIAELQDEGTLQIGQARFDSIQASGERISVSVNGESKEFDWVINCTGPSARWPRSSIVNKLVEAGHASYDPLGWGLMVDNDGKVVGADGLYALGTLTKGCRLECTAIPEIRQHAYGIAEGIAFGNSKSTVRIT